LAEVAAQCEGFNGADLGALLADAQLAAVHEVLAAPQDAEKVSLQQPSGLSIISWASQDRQRASDGCGSPLGGSLPRSE